MTDFNATAHKLLDVAERYTQLHGFNAFSYKDLQNEVGVKTSTIHYYFPTKQDLAQGMTDRYIERFRHALQEISQKHPLGLNRLEALGGIYVSVVREGKFCMCGMLASDMMSLSESVNRRLRSFFQLTESWIAEAIDLGIEQGQFKASINSAKAAPHLLAALEGGMLVSRSYVRPSYLESIIEEVFIQFSA